MTRQAFVKITSESLSQAVSILHDAGYAITGSLNSPQEWRTVILTVEGDGLPEACEAGLKQVDFTVSVEAYGSQSLRRISDVKLVELPA